MANKKQKMKRYKVYYFTGDYFSSVGEVRHYTLIEANNEHDAEYIFKKIYPNYSFGWIEKL